MLKVDTDGFDYHVLNSGYSIIKSNLPLIYFESLIRKSESEGICALNALDNLEKLGYSFLIFDSGGFLIGDFLIKDFKLFTRWYHQHHLYCDVLAFLPKDKIHKSISIEIRKEYGFSLMHYAERSEPN